MIEKHAAIAPLGAVLCILALALGPALGAFGMGSGKAMAQSSFKPIAVVNDSAITGFDLAQRARIFDVLGATSPTPDGLRQQALNSLIEERLKMQAAGQIGLERTDEVIDIGVDEFAQQFNETGEIFTNRMVAAGVTRKALEDYVVSEVLWREVVRNRFLRRAEPSEAAIDAEIALAGEDVPVSFRLRELGLQLSGDEAADRAIREKIIDLYQSVQNGANFEVAIAENSNIASAQNGGDVGWISASNLPPELARTLRTARLGEVLRPIIRRDAVTLLQLVERRVEAAGETPEVSEADREQVRRQLVNSSITRLADGLLQELRRDALIELR